MNKNNDRHSSNDFPSVVYTVLFERRSFGCHSILYFLYNYFLFGLKPTPHWKLYKVLPETLIEEKIRVSIKFFIHRCSFANSYKSLQFDSQRGKTQNVFGPMYIFAPKNSGWHSTNASQRTVSSRTTFIEVILKKKGENTLNRLLATYVHFIVLLSPY